jgi:hypothetical protein
MSSLLRYISKADYIKLPGTEKRSVDVVVAYFMECCEIQISDQYVITVRQQMTCNAQIDQVLHRK